MIHLRKSLPGLVGLITIGLVSLPAKAAPERAFLFSVGQASQSIGDMQGKLQTLGYTSVSVVDDSDDNALSFGVRYPLVARWTADLQYLQQGRTHPNVTATLPLGKTLTLAAEDAAKAMPKRGEGVSLMALYHHPVTLRQGLTLQAGLGTFIWQSERIATIGTQRHEGKDNGVSPIALLGVSYPLTKTIRLEAQWQHAFMPDEGVDRLGVGVAVRF